MIIKFKSSKQIHVYLNYLRELNIPVPEDLRDPYVRFGEKNFPILYSDAWRKVLNNASGGGLCLMPIG